MPREYKVYLRDVLKAMVCPNSTGGISKSFVSG